MGQPAQVHYLPLAKLELVNCQRLGRTFIEAEAANGHHYVWWHEQWWQWKGKHYTPVSEGTIQQALFYHVEDQFSKHNADKTTPSVTRSLLGDIMQVVRLLTAMDDRIEPPFNTKTQDRVGGWHINLANGILNVHSLFDGDVKNALRKHTPDWFSPAALPITFDPDAVCPQWDSFIREVFEGDEERVKLWEEWMGYCCVWDYSYQHAVIMVGEGRNGKGVCQKVLIDMLGRENVSAVPLGQFNERFGLGSMLGKLANIAGEIQGAGHIAEERLKQITGHDMVSVNIRYKPNVETRIPARLLFATNDVPEFKDRSKGLWRRLIIVPFNWEVPKEKIDTDLDKKLREELPGIFNRALAGLYRLVKQQGFTVPKLSTEASAVHQADSNPARRFLLTQTFAVPELSTPSGDVYKRYRDWSQDEGVAVQSLLSRPNFYKEVTRFYKATVSHVRLFQGENEPYRWVFKGLKVSGVTGEM
jgi:putative DNA primase/helicase